MSALSSDTEMGRSVEDLFHCTFHALSTIEWSHYVKSFVECLYKISKYLCK